MSAQITPAPDQANSPDVPEILVEFDEVNDTVIVTPGKIDKGTTVRFRNPKGGRLRIEFLLPNGKETESVSDSDPYTMKEGGTYHFKCFFTLEGKGEYCPKTGGVIDVVPQRP